MIKKTLIALCAGITFATSGCYFQKDEVPIEVADGVMDMVIEGSMMGQFKDKVTKLETRYGNFDLDNADILKYHKGDDRLVVYIRDIHREEVFQEKIYQTINELQKENGIELLLLENFPEKELTKEYIVDKLVNTDVVTKAVYYVLYGFWTPDTKEKLMKLADAGITYEYMNDTQVLTYGVEDEDIHDVASIIATRQPKGKGFLWLFKTVVVDKRNETSVENIVKYMKATGNDKAVFICGAAHTKGITEGLEKEGVSYIVVEPKGLEKALMIQNQK